MRRRKTFMRSLRATWLTVGEADKQAGFTWTESYYNPYRTDTFQDRETGRPISSAKFVDIWVMMKQFLTLCHIKVNKS